MDNALECKMSSKKFMWDVTPNRCGIYVDQVTTSLEPDNTNVLCKGKYHCTAGLLFDWFGYAPVNKYVVH